MKIQNNFSLGTVNQDVDERFLPPNALRDAENFVVVTGEGSDLGVGKNVSGNVKSSNLAIVGAKTIGCAALPSKNKVYNFIKGTNHDYIIEHDLTTGTDGIVLQSTTGTRLNFQTGERILNVDFFVSAEGNGDLMAFSGDSNPPRVINIDRAKTWGLDGFTAEELMVIKAPPLYPPTLEGTTSSENAESNNLQDRFLSFCYRWRYKDGYYSAISSWTRYFFVPGNFNLDFESFENLGMQNIYNAVDITFNTGLREVDAIDVIFKLSNSSTPYVVERFIKSEEGWADDTEQTIQFNNSKVYNVLPETEYFKSFDNVPLTAVSQTVIGNRLAYGNFVEGRDLIDKNGNPVVMDYSLDLVANNIVGSDLEIETESVDYNFDTPITINDAQLNIDFTDIDLVAGSSIFIAFDIKSDTEEIEFSGLFSFLLNDDYTDLADFLANSDFVTALQTDYTAYFAENGGITLPDGAIAGTIQQGFLVGSAGDILEITLPVVKYEIDEDPDPNTFTYDYFQDVLTVANFRSIAVSSSLKSRRSYEICMIYRDEQGRKTTALTSEDNTLFIPNENAITQNQIQVTIPPTQLPPVGFTTYKFGIKVNKGIYQQIIASVFFTDGTFRWVKLDGENKSKVKEGDILVVKKDSLGPLADVVKVKVLEIKLHEED